MRNEVDMIYMDSCVLKFLAEEMRSGGSSDSRVEQYSSSGSRVSSPGLEFDLFSINWVSA